MDDLPHSVLLHILSRLDDSADVARCRVAWKAFDTVFPGLRSINLRFSSDWYDRRVSNSQPFKTVFMDLVSKLESVESVCISLEGSNVVREWYDFHLIVEDFGKEWLPRVSNSLKSLSISGPCYDRRTQSNVLPLISKYCHNLVNLNLEYFGAWLSVHNLNLMPMLTSLTLLSAKLEDEHINEFNKCFPNLQALELLEFEGLKDPKIHFLNLKTFYIYDFYGNLSTLTLISPNLTRLTIECLNPTLHVEAPMLSHFHLELSPTRRSRVSSSFTFKKFDNLKTFWFDSLYAGSLLSAFPITKTVENLTLYSSEFAPTDSKLTIRKVFTVFPNLSFLCIKSGAWSELEACSNPEGREILDGRKGLKTIQAYLMLVDLSLTFSFVASVLDQCVSLSEVSLLVQADVDKTVSQSFMSKCMVRWPRLKWRWGMWSDEMEDSWNI